MGRARGRWLEMLLQCLLPEDTGEAIVGDLEEELSRRVRSGPRLAAAWWYGRQVAGSIVSLTCASLRARGPATIGVAVVAYAAASLIELAAGTVVSRVLPFGGAYELTVDLVLGLAAFAVAGYFATRFHRGAAVALSLIVVTVVLILMLTMPGTVPAWYAAAFLIAGPAAPLAGALLFVRRSRTARRR